MSVSEADIDQKAASTGQNITSFQALPYCFQSLIL